MFILETEGSVRLCITDICSFQAQWINWHMWGEEKSVTVSPYSAYPVVHLLIMANPHPSYLLHFIFVLCAAGPPCSLSMASVCPFRPDQSELECPTGTTSSFQTLSVVGWLTEDRLLLDYSWLKCGLCDCLLFLDWFIVSGDLNENIVPMVISCNSDLHAYESQNLVISFPLTSGIVYTTRQWRIEGH